MTRTPAHRPASRSPAWILVAAVALTAGCATYRPQPLDPSSVATALQSPTMESVKIAAAKIDHPLLAPIQIDDRHGLSPDEIAVMTVIMSPQLRALRDQRGVAQAQLLQAGLLPNPQLGYSFDQLHGNSDPTLVNGHGLGLSWEVTALLAHRDRVAAARATAGALDLSVAWQEWQVAQDARLRAFRLFSLEQRLPFAREIEDDLAANVAVLRRALALGQETAADLTTATAAWTQAQADRLTLEQQVNADRSALRLALGLPPEAPLRLRPSPPPAAPTLTPAALLDGLENRRLDLVALRLGYQSEDATLRAEVKTQFPKIGLSLGQATDTSDVRTRNFGVTVDLPFFDRNQGAVAAAQATRRQLFDEYVARIAEARAEVARILDDLADAQAQLRGVEDSLPALARLADSLAQSFHDGNADILAYREARGALAARRIERSRLQQSLLELEVALEIATGQPLLASRSST